MTLILSIILVALNFGAVIFLVFFFASFLLPVFSGAPYVPTTTATLQKMLRLANIKAGSKTADLGSGDGKLVIAAALLKAEAHGFEINPVLVWLSRWRIARAGVSKNAFIHLKSFWQANLSDFDVIMIYGLTNVMPKLEKKLKKELRPGAVVVSNAFKFSQNWPPHQSDGGAYLYRISELR